MVKRIPFQNENLSLEKNDGKISEDPSYLNFESNFPKLGCEQQTLGETIKSSQFLIALGYLLSTNLLQEEGATCNNSNIHTTLLGLTKRSYANNQVEQMQVLDSFVSNLAFGSRLGKFYLVRTLKHLAHLNLRFPPC